MKTFLSLFLLLISFSISAQEWVQLSDDPEGDGFFPKRQDARDFAYWYDKASDSIWFKLSVYGDLDIDNWGFNIIFDTDLNDATGRNWPAPQNNFSFDISLTVWVTGSLGNYKGTIGMATANDMMSGRFTALYQNNIRLMVDTTANAYIVALPRKHIDPEDINFEVFASIGISGEANDYVPNTGGMPINLSLNVKNRQAAQPAVHAYPNPCSNHINIVLPNASQGPFRYHIADITGNIHLPGQTDASSFTLNIDALKPGYYLLRLQNDHTTQTVMLQKL